MLTQIRSLWRNLVQRERVDRDLNDEVRAALDLLVDENVRAGMTVEEARRSARIQLGSHESITSHVRDVRINAVETLRYE